MKYKLIFTPDSNYETNFRLKIFPNNLKKKIKFSFKRPVIKLKHISMAFEGLNNVVTHI